MTLLIVLMTLRICLPLSTLPMAVFGPFISVLLQGCQLAWRLVLVLSLLTPESRSLIHTENLVRQTFEFAVGLKIKLVDFRRLGKEKSRPLIVKLASVWDRRLLLNTKYKLKHFKGVRLFVCED